MTDFLDALLDHSTALSDWIWGLPLSVLLFASGLLLTFVTGFVQIRNLGRATRLVLSRSSRTEDGAPESRQGDISPFQALMTSLSATVGNGNIAGVATAIAAGGPGAAFWMWVTAIFGMATKYSEAVLAVRFRERTPDGSTVSGPMYYCERGIRHRALGMFLGRLFAVCGGVTALIGTGNLFQSQQIALAANRQFGTPFWITGLAVSVLVGLVILGGIKRIGRVAEKLVPAMIVFYFAGALLVLVTHFSSIPAAIVLIVKSAFNPQAALGGAIGIGIQHAMRFGVARGVLSNESGLGSAAIAHGAARAKSPVDQGHIAMMGTFIDTIIVCSLTAMVITLSGAYDHATFRVGEGGLSGSDLTVSAFHRGLPSPIASWGGGGVVLASLVFGFTTMIGWSYYGQVCLEYLFGLKIIRPYRIVYVILLFAGALFTGKYATIVTNVGDICNASMALPNLIALVLLCGTVRRLTREASKARE